MSQSGAAAGGGDDDLARRVRELEGLVEAMRNKTKMLEDELEERDERIDELEHRVADLEGQVTTDDAAKEYHEKTREEKVLELRAALARRARSSSTEKASMDYKNVLSLFGEHPSPGHAYQLMKLAAEYDEETKTSEKPGFHYEPHEGRDRNKSIRVNLPAVKDKRVFHAVNKGTDGEGGN